MTDETSAHPTSTTETHESDQLVQRRANLAELAANGVLTAARLIPVHIEDPGRPRPDPQRRVIDIVRKLSADDFGSPVFDANGAYSRQAASARK